MNEWTGECFVQRCQAGLAVAVAALGRRIAGRATSQRTNTGGRERLRGGVCAGCQAEVTLLACERRQPARLAHHSRVVVTHFISLHTLPQSLLRRNSSTFTEQRLLAPTSAAHRPFVTGTSSNLLSRPSYPELFVEPSGNLLAKQLIHLLIPPPTTHRGHVSRSFSREVQVGDVRVGRPQCLVCPSSCASAHFHTATKQQEAARYSYACCSGSSNGR